MRRFRSNLKPALKKSPPLIAFDFDGTLAPIVKKRGAANMRPSTLKLFKKVTDRFTVAVLTGRSQKDIKNKLRDFRIASFVGNHGAEIDRKVLVSPLIVARWKKSLQKTLKGLEGVDIEDKKFSLSIHFREAPSKSMALREIRNRLHAVRGAKIIDGKDVVNVLPKNSPGKGRALKQVMKNLKMGSAVFIGDDVTDEDVFEISSPEKILCFRVGALKGSKAQFYLQNQGEIDSFLRWLLRDPFNY